MKQQDNNNDPSTNNHMADIEEPHIDVSASSLIEETFMIFSSADPIHNVSKNPLVHAFSRF